jgi:hypothetical protein
MTAAAPALPGTHSLLTIVEGKVAYHSQEFAGLR